MRCHVDMYDVAKSIIGLNYFQKQSVHKTNTKFSKKLSSFLFFYTTENELQYKKNKCPHPFWGQLLKISALVFNVLISRKNKN